MNKEPVYTLNCDNCGQAYESQEGFPKPQLCPKCQPSGEKPPVLTKKDVELQTGNLFGDGAWQIVEEALTAQRDTDAVIFDVRIEQARKEERRKLIEEARHTCPHMRGHCSLLKELEEAK